jgi:hypothetical protein
MIVGEGVGAAHKLALTNTRSRSPCLAAYVPPFLSVVIARLARLDRAI